MTSATMKFKLNKATEFTIHGWFRQIDTHELNIPYAIKHLVGAFFRTYDKFIHHFFGQYTIDQNSTRVSTVRKSPNGNCEFHGEIEIKRNDFVQWQFQIDKFAKTTINDPGDIHRMIFGLRKFCHSEGEFEEFEKWTVGTEQKIQGTWQYGWKDRKWQQVKWVAETEIQYIGRKEIN